MTVLNPGPSEAENVELEFYKGTGEGLVSLGQPEPANNLAINGVLRCHLKLRTANELLKVEDVSYRLTWTDGNGPNVRESSLKTS